MTATVEQTRRVPGPGAVVIGGVVGAVVGLVLGALAAGGIWIWAFAQGLNGTAVRVPGLVTVEIGASETSAEAGPLLLLLPLAAALVAGAVVAVVVGSRRAALLRSTRS
jgi:hypothetical protein